MSRSRTGCYTCRIRKKKCDEQRPICVNCSSRGIECHGFGPRPRWMMGVSRDAEEMREIRRAAAGTYQARRNPWSEVSLAVTKVDEDRDVGREGVQAVSAVRSWQDETEKMMPPGWHSSLSIRGSLPTSPVLISVVPTAPAAPQDLMALPPPPPSMDSIWWHSGLRDTSNNIRDKADLATVLHYLNQVFPVIHEFQQDSSPEQGRRWILNLLLRSEPMYWACLSLSTCHRILITDGKSKPGSKDATILNQQTVVTLRTLQTRLAEVPNLTGTELLATGFELLGCMIEVTSLEVFRDIEGLYDSHWETHMCGIRSLLATITTDPLLESAVHDPTASSKVDTIEALLSHSQPHHLSLLSPSDIDAFNYFITCFVWADILSQALGILPPHPSQQTTFRYAPLLENNILNLSKVMGAENWAMVSIYHTNILRDIKNDHLEIGNGHLSDDLEMILHTRAAEISSSLETGLAQLLTVRPLLTGLQLDSSLVTEAFALACLIYLWASVHGAHPAHPAIRGAFARSLRALLSLPSRLLVRVAWPFAVTGCFAGGDEAERALFRGMVRMAVAEGRPCGTCGRGLRVMRAVWARRDGMREEGQAGDGDGMDGVGVGWAEGMRCLKVRVLII